MCRQLNPNYTPVDKDSDIEESDDDYDVLLVTHHVREDELEGFNYHGFM
jgi:hypothetical protein